MAQSRARQIRDPGIEAAGLLLRTGMVILCLIVPVLVFLNRRSVVVLAPMGLTLTILAGMIRAEDFAIMRTLRRVLSSVSGAIAVLLALWICLSLLWTPFPAEAGEKLFKVLGTAALILAAVFSLPERMRAPNLHLITIGSLLATIAGTVIAGLQRLDRGMVPIDAVTMARAAVLLSVLSFAAMAWLNTRAQPRLSVVLMALVGAMTLIGRSHIAQFMFALGCAAYLCALLRPRASALVLGWLAVATLIGAPLAALLADAASLRDLGAGNLVIARLQPLAEWGAFIAAEPLRLLTGHGLDTAGRARASALIPPETMRNIVFELWFELGLIGAVAAAVLVFRAYLGATRLPRSLTAPLIGALTSALCFALLGDGIVQIWWLSSVASIAIAFVAVVRGQHRTVRPKARASAVRAGPEVEHAPRAPQPSRERVSLPASRIRA